MSPLHKLGNVKEFERPGYDRHAHNASGQAGTENSCGKADLSSGPPAMSLAFHLAFFGAVFFAAGVIQRIVFGAAEIVRGNGAGALGFLLVGLRLAGQVGSATAPQSGVRAQVRAGVWFALVFVVFRLVAV